MSSQTLTFQKAGMMYTIPIDRDPGFYELTTFVYKKPGRLTKEDIEDRKRIAHCYMNYVKYNCQYSEDIMKQF